MPSICALRAQQRGSLHGTAMCRLIQSQSSVKVHLNGYQHHSWLAGICGSDFKVAPASGPCNRAWCAWLKNLHAKQQCITIIVGPDRSWCHTVDNAICWKMLHAGRKRSSTQLRLQSHNSACVWAPQAASKRDVDLKWIGREKDLRPRLMKGQMGNGGCPSKIGDATWQSRHGLS